MLKGKNVIVGVSGGIAAYKAVEVVSRLRKLEVETHVIMTRNATKLVAPMTFRTISCEPVAVEMFEEPKRWNVEHIALAEAADLFLVCPATANVIGKIACGIADDFLTTTILACVAPKLICPAMNSNMYANPAVQENLERLRKRGYGILEPEYGRLASGAVGKGRLPDPEKIVSEAVRILSRAADLEGTTILITAGPTREYIDPVRFISPPSSGKMGYALAEAAAERGARVILVSGPAELEPPAGVETVRVTSTRDMLEACLRVYPGVNAVIGAAAPSDFRPAQRSDRKIKKTGAAETLTLVPTEDIMRTLGQEKGHRVLVGFAAESENVLAYALEKARAKNLDFVCANQVGLPDRGFGADTNAVSVVCADGSHEDLPFGTKREIAGLILDRVRKCLDKLDNRA
jgi:phosphopantothenoylcysteine decarboxylase/phosphopantothenate--cysteine ligase